MKLIVSLTTNYTDYEKYSTIIEKIRKFYQNIAFYQKIVYIFIEMCLGNF